MAITPRILTTDDLGSTGTYRIPHPANPGDNGKLAYASGGYLAYLAHGSAGSVPVANGSGFEWGTDLGDITVTSLASAGVLSGAHIGATAHGNFAMSGGQWHIQYKRVQLTGTQRVTLAGTARYILTDL